MVVVWDHIVWVFGGIHASTQWLCCTIWYIVLVMQSFVVIASKLNHVQANPWSTPLHGRYFWRLERCIGSIYCWVACQLVGLFFYTLISTWVVFPWCLFNKLITYQNNKSKLEWLLFNLDFFFPVLHQIRSWEWLMTLHEHVNEFALTGSSATIPIARNEDLCVFFFFIFEIANAGSCMMG